MARSQGQAEAALIQQLQFPGLGLQALHTFRKG